MNCGDRDIKIKRVSGRKRSRDGVQSHMTPARKRGGAGGAGGGGGADTCSTDRRVTSIMAQPAEFCSDTEDLFGDYDSLLGDSSLLAKLDDAEQDERRRELQLVAVDQQDLAALPPPEDRVHNRSCQDVLTDSILDVLGDEPFEDLPVSQMQFEEQIGEGVKRNKPQDGDNTSTPSRNAGDSGHRRTSEAGTDRHTDDKTRRRSRARRSVTDQLKRTMLCNAAAPSNISRSVGLKEAVVSEEISVAMQAMETVSTETTDLGPFFGLPSKVKDLMYKLRGIKSLYGDGLFHYGFIRLCKRVKTKCSSQFLRDEEDEFRSVVRHGDGNERMLKMFHVLT